MCICYMYMYVKLSNYAQEKWFADVLVGKVFLLPLILTCEEGISYTYIGCQYFFTVTFFTAGTKLREGMLKHSPKNAYKICGF